MARRYGHRGFTPPLQPTAMQGSRCTPTLRLATHIGSRPPQGQRGRTLLEFVRKLDVCRGPESNWRHMALQTIALPTELPRRAPSTATVEAADAAIERLPELGAGQEPPLRCSGY